MIVRSFCLAVLLVIGASLPAQTSTNQEKTGEVKANDFDHLMDAAQFLAIPSKTADYHLLYGKDSNQFGDLRVPPGAGPHPVAILIHGGCWKDFASLRDLAPMADMLKTKGIATWNIEYRRLGQNGSGWPGTFRDVSAGVDFLRSIATQYQLDLTRVIVVGHSSGGQLAMWVAARPKLPSNSPLYVDDPLHIKGVIDLAGIADMEALIPIAQHACHSAVVEELLGGKPVDVPERYHQTSAIKMLPLGVPQTLFWGREDNLAPISMGEAYTEMAKRAGDPARLVSFPNAGHFEIASPLSSPWPDVEGEIFSLLAKR